MDLDAISRSDTSDFKLGEWWVRPQHNELEKMGEATHVEARSMAVLVCLGRHAPALVTKERLLEEVWSDSPYVGDDVISHAIWELRKALGDSARDPSYIQTVPRKGYRLIAEILRPQGSPLPMEGAQIDHYDLGPELGRGSMGVVYQAVDRRLDRTVAIKFLAPELTRDPKANERFQREARLAASLDHPNLATVHEIGETSNGQRYLVNAYYPGGSLKDLVASGPVAVEQAQRLIRQLVAGLGAAHQRDIVHRDIKPANLLLDEHGTLKICDFGIAKLLGATDLTRTGTPLGTPAYKSPEQARGRTVDHRTDLWSVGVVFFELLTGCRPFDGGYEHAVVHAILSREPRALEEVHGGPVPEPLRRFIARALAKDPAQRFQSAEEMAKALDEFDTPSPPLPPATQPRKGMMITLGLLAALLFLGLWSYQQNPQRPTETLPTTIAQEGQDHLAQGRSQWLRGNHPANLQEVRKHFERAVELLPNSADAKAHLAAFLADNYAIANNDLRLEDRKEALRLIEEVLAADPQSSVARAAQAWILILDGKYETGEDLAREARASEAHCVRGGSCDLAYLWLGEALAAKGRVEEALSILEQGTQVGGGHIRCRLKMAQLYEELGDSRQAEGAYFKVLQLDRTQTTALNGLANFYIEARRCSEALPRLRASHKTTQDPATLISIGYCLYERQFWDEAIDTYREAHQAYKDLGNPIPTPLMAIGDIYLEQGEREQAQEQYRLALEIFNAMSQPSINRKAQHAVCLAKLDQFAEAEEKITPLMDLVEGIPDLLYYAARIAALQGHRGMLFSLATQWAEKSQDPTRFLDDPAFIPYRKNPEYLAILEPGLLPAG